MAGSKPLGSHFGVGAPPILVYFSGDWDVHWGDGLLTHGQMSVIFCFAWDSSVTPSRRFIITFEVVPTLKIHFAISRADLKNGTQLSASRPLGGGCLQRRRGEQAMFSLALLTSLKVSSKPWCSVGNMGMNPTSSLEGHRLDGFRGHAISPSLPMAPAGFVGA